MVNNRRDGCDLVAACSADDINRVKSLLESGADPNKRCNERDGETPLLAVASKCGKNAAKICELLVTAGGDPNSQGEFGETPLMSACAVGGKRGDVCALALLRLGADPNVVRPDKSYALLRAAQGSGVEVVRAMVEAGALVDGPDGARITPLHRAAENGRSKTVKMLLQLGANVELKCKLKWALGKTAAEIAEANGEAEIAKMLRGGSR